MLCIRVCTLLILAVSNYAAPSISHAAETDLEKFVRLTQQLEINPLGNSDKSVRASLMQWVTETKEVSVTVCDILGPIPGEDLPHGPLLLMQSIFGNAAFQISNPSRTDDMLAMQLAGVRSSLRSYSSIVERTSETRIPYFDELLEKERAGSLEVFLAPIVATKCE